jgi:hypothetical protein
LGFGRSCKKIKDNNGKKRKINEKTAPAKKYFTLTKNERWEKGIEIFRAAG